MPQDAGGTEAAEERALALVDRYLKESHLKGVPYSWNVKPLDYPSGQEALAATPDFQIACIHALMRRLDTYHSGPPGDLLNVGEISIGPFRLGGITWDESQRLQALLSALLRRHQPFGAPDVRRILDRVRRGGDRWWDWMPAQGVLRSVQRYVAQHGLSDELRLVLEDTRAAGVRHAATAPGRNALRLVEALLGVAPEEPLLDREDDWGRRAAAALERMTAPDLARWTGLLQYVRQASGSHPSRKWLQGARRRVDAMGEEPVARTAAAWLGLLEEASPAETTVALARASDALVRGIAWACSTVADPRLAAALGRAAGECYRKIPDVGSRSTVGGNACVYALGQMPGIHGAVQLQQLRQRVKQPSALKQIEKALEAASAREGLTRTQLEDMAVPDFGLVDGSLRVPFGPYTAELAVTAGSRDAEVRWTDAQGAPLKSVPAAVKRDHADELRDLKRTAADLKRALTTQRARLERLLLLPDRDWSLDEWRTRFLHHPLLSPMARRLIWRFSADGDVRAAGAPQLGTWLDGRLVDVHDRPLEDQLLMDGAVRVRLWHPIESAPEDVLAWRTFLERHETVQPFKQAHREVYLLTDAERATETYSNRFAAHILRQHQLHALCLERGWAHVLEGGFDNGAGPPELALPEWDMVAQFFVEGIHDNDAAYSGAGICLYLTTDRVCFGRLRAPNAYEPIRLADVPPVVFSEVMRDVDLFVGVCSVGNDPNWQATGGGRHTDYWQRYAFGELSETAGTRRAAIERLLPRLSALAGRASVDGKFLVVRGTLRAYKIHLGSGNILMTPNDEYLCIVPNRGQPAEARTDGVFLPFEGDSTLALILSKAFLLAADDKITDPTITRQIKRAG